MLPILIAAIDNKLFVKGIYKSKTVQDLVDNLPSITVFVE
jgi:hypothetical protein